jgi:hypothetical protein
MKSFEIAILKLLRRIHANAFGVQVTSKPARIVDPDAASKQIRTLLENDSPVMIARFGSNELSAVINYLEVKSDLPRSRLDYVRGKSRSWWWKPGMLKHMVQCAGFFPAQVSALERFCELMLRDIPEIDLLGSWLPEEQIFDGQLANTVKVDLELLNPYFSSVPWTRALEGKKVLVIHPFARMIETQYKKREQLFKNDLLPAFDLKTIKAVQSIGGECAEFVDWFAALESMKSAMDHENYDICLIGCGAYGLPLAAHAKRSGKKGFHIGGSLQLLFGIRGKRWENPGYNPNYNYSLLMNEHWIRPGKEETPSTADRVEGACYW